MGNPGGKKCVLKKRFGLSVLMFQVVFKRFFDPTVDCGGSTASSGAIGRPSFQERFPLASGSRNYGEKQSTGRETWVL